MKKLVNTGSELANLILQSNVLEDLWRWNSDNKADTPSSSSSPTLRSKEFDNNPKWTVISFATSPAFSDESSGLVKSTVSGKSFELFKSLCRKTDFAINEAAIDLFHKHIQELSHLKDRIIERINPKNNNRKALIITGHALGGSVASLFMLWLLDSVSFSGKKPLICITFGSPLIGDSDLQKALYKYTPWSSNFLNIASTRDPVLRSFASGDLGNYMPFGTFLLCSESGCSCFEAPEMVMKLLQTHVKPDPDFDYGSVVANLKRQALFKKTVGSAQMTPYQQGIFEQLSAIGLVPTKEMGEEIEKHEMKFQMGKRTVRPDKKLNDSKMNMSKLEWYMKMCRDQRTSYYDRYKDMRFSGDMNIQECVKRLMNYWTDQIEEADMKPQAEGETLRSRWLYSGLNYLRIVEPLYIAEYYHHRLESSEEAPPLRYYAEEGRPTHFKRLAELVAEAKEKEIAENVADKNKKYSVPIEEKKKRVGAALTEDSLFWAKVEEAFFWCGSMRKGASEDEKRDFASKLGEFENYVFKSVKNYDVSTEIFFENSRFMMWWRDYNEAMGVNYDSRLKNIMVNKKYKKYCTGELDL